jgi:N4-gp56 family major capsid protein
MALTNTTTWSEYVQTAFDTTVAWFLRDMPMFRQIVDKRPVSQAMPGSPITLTIEGEMPLATTALSENTDIDSVVMADPRQVSVTPLEYGNSTIHTLKLTKQDFTAATVKRIGQSIAFNQADSIDSLVKTVIDSGTNILYSLNTTGPGDTTGPAASPLNAFNAAAAVSLLRGRKAQPREGEMYMAYIHPDVAYDLRLAAGTTAWQNPHSYVDTANIYNGEVGSFHGARYVETNRCTLPTATTYNTYYFGRECLLEASCIEPHVVVGPVVDKLKRFFPVGWYAFLGWTLYRQNALQLVRTTSSINALHPGTYDPKA